MGYSHQYWYPKDKSCLATRSFTPTLRGDEAYLHKELHQLEGIYHIEAWPAEGRGRISFSFYHHGTFQPVMLLWEGRPEVDPYEWFRDLYGLDPLKFPRSKALFLPVLERDQAIKRLDLNFETGVRRVRDYKRHLIYLAKIEGPCDDWATNHIHAVRVRIVDDLDRQLLCEEYTCAHVWAGIMRYQEALSDLNVIRMEQSL